MVRYAQLKNQRLTRALEIIYARRNLQNIKTQCELYHLF